MSKYYVVNTVRIGRKTYNQNEEISCDGDVAKSLLKSGAITTDKPKVKPEKNNDSNPPKGKEMFSNPFLDLEVDDQHAKALCEAGIDSIEKLGEKTVEELTAINGISNKYAKKLVDCFEDAE